MPYGYNDIQKAFIDGVEEVYVTMFTAKEEIVNLYLLDVSTEVDNVYEEALVKKYLDPIPLAAKAIEKDEQGERPVESNQKSITFRVPYKEFLLKDISIEADNWEYLRQGKFEHKGFQYQIDTISPASYVANVFLFYEFKCTEII